MEEIRTEEYKDNVIERENQVKKNTRRNYANRRNTKKQLQKQILKKKLS